MRVSKGVMGAVRTGYRALPHGMRHKVEDRFFYAVFNVTRVTNDNYGWRPEEPGGRPPPDRERPQEDP